MVAKSVWWQISYHREQTNTRATPARAGMSPQLLVLTGTNSVECIISEKPYGTEEFIFLFSLPIWAALQMIGWATASCFTGICSLQAVHNNLCFTLHRF